MKVLVVASNRCRDPEPVLPAGACLVTEAAERAGHQVRLLDLMFHRRPTRAVKLAVASFHPEAVLVSIRNVDNSDRIRPEFFLPAVRKLVRAARVGRCPVATGGAAVSMDPRGVGRAVGADWVLTGEGETVVPAYLSALGAGSDPAELPGVAQVEGDPGCRPPPEAPLPPTPDYRRWVPWSAYRARMAAAPVQTKRGCPFTCTYCTYPSLEGRRVRLRNPEAVADDLVRLGKRGIRHVEIVDGVFNTPVDHALEICRAAARIPTGVALTTHDLCPAGLDTELVDALVPAGFRAVGVSIESAADPVLEGMGKPFDAAQVHRAAAALGRSSLAVLWIVLLGGPGETVRTATETLDFIRKTLRPGDAAWVGVGIRIYPGTALADRARREGTLEEEGDLVKPVFYHPRDIRLETLIRLVEEAARADPRILWGGAPGWRLLPAVRRAGAALGWQPPLWRHAPRVRRWLQRARFS